MIYGQRNFLSMPMRDQAGMTPQSVIGQRAQVEEQREKRALQQDAELRKQRRAKREKTKQYQDLYNKEMNKIGGYYSRGGKRENVSEVYLRNLDILKHKATGKRRPLDMIDVFGRQ